MTETVSETSIYRRARRAYELGRAGVAARHGALVLAVAALGMVGCTRRLAAALAALLVATLAGAAEWRGQAWRRGARAGLLAGLAPFFLPLGSTWLARLAGGGTCPPALWACIAGGVLGGVTLALGDRRSGRQPAFWAAAGAVALACGTVGCLEAGLAGLAGMALGLSVGVGAVPVLVHATATRH
jgi:hypothetical protein